MHAVSKCVQGQPTYCNLVGMCPPTRHVLPEISHKVSILSAAWTTTGKQTSICQAAVCIPLPLCWRVLGSVE